jgi:polysaccharide export outer membrane protein
MRGVAVALTCILVLAGCANSLPPLQSGDGPYRLDSGDEVRVIVYNELSLSTTYHVSDGGTISLPMIGEIAARDLTIEELQQEIYTKLNSGILKNPGVSVEISTYRPFYIVGEISKPGQYPYASGLNVLTAVAIAGGFTVRADEKHMTVMRTRQGHAGEWKAERVTTLQPGDVVVVHERFF